MLIAQVTDLHLDAQNGVNCENTWQFRRVLADIKEMRRQPDMMIVTGDLAENGGRHAYEALRSEVSGLDMPLYFAMGNHDDRTTFRSCFPESQFNDGYLQYSLDKGPFRVIVIDTSEPGRHGGAFCERRANWLEAELAKAPHKPTLIAMHHPPTDMGIPWMAASETADWVQRFKTVVKTHNNIVHIMCGHIHRTIFKRFDGTTLSVASAVAPQVKLDLSAIKVNNPDGRVLLEEANPGYALHHWDGEALTTHNVIVGARPIIYYDQTHAHIVQETMAQA